MENCFLRDAIVLMAKVSELRAKVNGEYVDTGKFKLTLTVLGNSSSLDTGEIFVLTTDGRFNNEQGVPEDFLDKFRFADKVTLFYTKKKFNNEETRIIDFIKLKDGFSLGNADEDLPF